MSFGASWGKRGARKAREAPFIRFRSAEQNAEQSYVVITEAEPCCDVEERKRQVQRKTAVVQSSSNSN